MFVTVKHCYSFHVNIYCYVSIGKKCILKFLFIVLVLFSILQTKFQGANLFSFSNLCYEIFVCTQCFCLVKLVSNHYKELLLAEELMD